MNTYVFRPLSKGNWTRYAEGRWVDDDGEPDMAFYKGSEVLMVHPPTYAGLLWTWRDSEASHGAGQWHYHVVNPEQGFGKYLDVRRYHPNCLVGQEAMDMAVSKAGCASGGGPHITGKWDMDRWIEAEQVWIAETMKPVKVPDPLNCFLCLEHGRGHSIVAQHEKLANCQGRLDYAREELSRLNAQVYVTENEIERLQGAWPNEVEALKELRGMGDIPFRVILSTAR